MYKYKKNLFKIFYNKLNKKLYKLNNYNYLLNQLKFKTNNIFYN